MTMMLVLAALQEWSVDVRGSDVHVSGKTSEAAVTLEFRRRVNRVEKGRLESATAEDLIVRRVTADGGVFSHVESFQRPEVVELRGILDDCRVLEAVVRVGSTASAVAWAKAGVRRIAAAADGLRAISRRGERTRRRLAAWRASGEASELPGAGAALAALAGDVEQALQAKAGACPFLSEMDGRPFKFENLAERAAALVDFAERERDLLLLEALAGVVDEAAALALGGDAKRWARAEPGFRRSIDHLKQAGAERLSALVDPALDLIDLAAEAAECPSSNAAELERRREEWSEESRRLEAILRTPA